MTQLSEKIVKDFNWTKCKCGGVAWMLTLGGIFYRIRCMQCRRHTPLFVLSSEALSEWGSK